MREAQAELEAEERAVQLEIESLERRQQRLDQKASEDLVCAPGAGPRGSPKTP